MNKTILLCLVLAILTGCSPQEIKLLTAKPEKVGMSSERLNRIKPVMQGYIDENKLLGMITMVAAMAKLFIVKNMGVWMLTSQCN